MRKYKDFDDYYFKEIGICLDFKKLFRRAKSLTSSKIIFFHDTRVNDYDLRIDAIVHFTSDKKHPYHFVSESYIMHPVKHNYYILDKITLLTPESRNLLDFDL